MPADPRALTDEEIAKLRLLRTARIGPVSYRQLVQRFGSAVGAMDALPDLVRRGGARPPRIAPVGLIEKEARALRQAGGHYLFCDDRAFPSLLNELPNAPAVVTFAGSLELAHQPCVAIVGARNASAAACRFARQLAGDMAEAGIITVSGLARGIDGAAHAGAMGNADSPAPRPTIGVIASGLDIAYPRENAALQRAMQERALVIAEQPPGTEPLARHFPFRNRIIAGLAMATLVVEAAPRSGSLITARLAAEAGRDVLAIPGSPLDPRSRGANMLIREGATLVQGVDDILEVLGGFSGDPQAQLAGRVREPEESGVLGPIGNPSDQPAHSASHQPLLAEPDDRARSALTDLLGPVAVSVDELVRQSGLSTATAQMVLLELELAGRLERHAGGKVTLMSD